MRSVSRRLQRAAFWLSAAYCTLGLLWIGLSDSLLNLHPGIDGPTQLVQFAKGSLYVLVTSFGLYLIARWFIRRLLQSEDRYQTLVENQGASVCCWLPDTTITFVNARYATDFGQSPAQLVGQRWLTLVPDSHLPAIQAMIAKLIEVRLPQTYVHPVLMAGGHTRYMEWTDIPVTDPAGAIRYIQSIGRDVTQRVQAQEHLRRSNADLEQANQRLQEALVTIRETQSQIVQQERLQALGEMASGIAHDFNNSLAVVRGYGDLLLMQNDRLPPDKRAQYLTHILTATRDAETVVNRLREFYRQREGCSLVNPLDLASLAEQTVELTRPRWESQPQAHGIVIRLLRQLGPTPDILGCEAELREALTNLIGNAVDAMPHGGTLTLRTVAADNRVTLEVADTGIGMDDDTVRRCLEPFFTTKGARGTGLGLAAVNHTVRRHSATLAIQSAPGKGTTFSIQFPLPASSPPSPPAPAPAGESPAPHPHRDSSVLLVDDDPLVRSAIRAVLAFLDLQSVEASTGREALDHYQPGRFAIVITDLAMPDLNGDQLIAAIRRQDPRQPIILLTGFGEFMIAAGQNPGADLILSKPVSADELCQAIDRFLPSPPSPSSS